MDRTGQQPVILVGVGGSAASLAALAWAAQEARRRRVPLRIVQAWHPRQARALYAGIGPGVRDWPSEPAAAERLGRDVRSVLGDTDGLDYAAELIDGSAERVLAEASATASLLVLGTGSQSPVSHPDPRITDRPVGPVIRACLSHARCPVVIITPTIAAEYRLTGADLAYQLSLAGRR